MKKTLVTTILLLTLAVNTFALVPLAIPLWYWGGAVALHVAGAAAGLYYAMSPNLKAQITSTGSISRDSSAAFIDLGLSEPAVIEKNIKAEMSFEDFKAIARSKNVDGSQKYPLTERAISDWPKMGPLYIDSPVGTVIGDYKDSYNIVTGKLGPTSSQFNAESWSSYLANQAAAGKTVIFEAIDAANFYFRYTSFTLAPTVNPPTVPKTDNQIIAVMNGSSSEAPSDAPVVDQYQLELDKMFQDDNYVPTFTDSGGLPYSPPPSSQVATPAQVAAYNAAETAKTTATAAAGTAVTSATGAVTAAQGAVSAAQGAVTANPNDVGLQLQLAAAQKGLADAQAALDKLKSEQATGDAENATNATITAPASGGAYGDGETSDFGARFNTFMTDMKGSGIFALPGQLLGNIPGGGQSHFDLNFGRFGNTTFDLASFGSAIALIRSLVLIIFSVAGFRIVTLKGGAG